MQIKRSKSTRSRVINAVIAILTILALTSGDLFIMGQEVMALSARNEFRFSALKIL